RCEPPGARTGGIPGGGERLFLRSRGGVRRGVPSHPPRDRHASVRTVGTGKNFAATGRTVPAAAPARLSACADAARLCDKRELADLIENRPPEDLEAEFDHSPGLVEQYVFDRQAYRIVIALREDYLAALESMRERAPSLGRNRFRLTPMNGRQALEAVVRPGG